MRRSFPQMHMVLVVVAWVETRVSMGCRLEYEGECGRGWLSSFPLVRCNLAPKSGHVVRFTSNHTTLAH
jgi:hypothetical protein